MIGLTSTGYVSGFRPQVREKWVLLAGVYLGFAYQIVPVDERRGVWRWTFYPPIGDGESRSGEFFGASGDAERACMAAIKAFARDLNAHAASASLALHAVPAGGLRR